MPETKTEFDIHEYVTSQQKETDDWKETQKAREILSKQGQIAHIWSWEDIIYRAWDQRELKLTREQAENILSDIERKVDSELGITWITLDCWIDEGTYLEK